MGYQSTGRSETIQPSKSYCGRFMWLMTDSSDGGPSVGDFILCPPYVAWKVFSQEASVWEAVIFSTICFLLWPLLSVLLTLFMAGVACVESCERRDGYYEEPPEQARLDRAVNDYRKNKGSEKNQEGDVGNTIALRDKWLIRLSSEAIKDYCTANGIELESGDMPQLFSMLEEGSCKIVVDTNNLQRWWIEYTAGEEMKRWVENTLTRSKTGSSYISDSSGNQNRGVSRICQYGSNDNTPQTLFFSSSNNASSLATNDPLTITRMPTSNGYQSN